MTPQSPLIARPQTQTHRQALPDAEVPIISATAGHEDTLIPDSSMMASSSWRSTAGSHVEGMVTS